MVVCPLRSLSSSGPSTSYPLFLFSAKDSVSLCSLACPNPSDKHTPKTTLRIPLTPVSILFFLFLASFAAEDLRYVFALVWRRVASTNGSGDHSEGGDAPNKFWTKGNVVGPQLLV